VTTFIVVLSIWIYSSAFEMFTWASKIYPYYALPYQVIIPMILLGISLLRKKGKDNAK
jgi:spore germination protein KB